MVNFRDGAIYEFISVKGGTAIDLSGSETVTGNTPNNSDRQKWILKKYGNLWLMKSKADNTKYLTITGHPEYGKAVIVGSTPSPWDIRPDDEDRTTYRIYMPTSTVPGPINMNLVGGLSSPYTPIILSKKSPETSQTWLVKEAHDRVSIHAHGVYQIVNVKSGTALDLSGSDNHSIIGWTPHGGDNQKWILKPYGALWQIVSKSNGKHITWKGRLEYGKQVIAEDEHGAPWAIAPDPFEQDPSVFSIFLPRTVIPGAVAMDLAEGNSCPGTSVILSPKETRKSQAWRFIPAN